jgi:single-strand DNA-binding protein
MADINVVTFTGRLTRDAVRKSLPSGAMVVQFDIANNYGYGDYAKTAFFTVNLWGKSGDGVAPYLLKGQLVGVTGSLEVQTWDSQSGEKRQKNVINSSNLILLGGKAAGTETKADDIAY